MKFLLQTVNRKVVHDFVFVLERNIEFQKWQGNDIEVEYTELEDLRINFGMYRDCIPVGTVEFVIEYCRLYIRDDADKFLKPLNIPESLYRFRHGLVLPGNDIPDGQYYCKSTTIIKSSKNGVRTAEWVRKNISRQWQVTKMENIVSEWRVFINRGEILNAKCYSGDFMKAPNWDVVKDMVKTWRHTRPATLDVFINQGGCTQIMECHEFWSCSTYGFEHPSLAQMFSQAFFDIKSQLKELHLIVEKQ